MTVLVEIIIQLLQQLLQLHAHRCWVCSQECSDDTSTASKNQHVAANRACGAAKRLTLCSITCAGARVEVHDLVEALHQLLAACTVVPHLLDAVPQPALFDMEVAQENLDLLLSLYKHLPAACNTRC